MTAVALALASHLTWGGPTSVLLFFTWRRRTCVTGLCTSRFGYQPLWHGAVSTRRPVGPVDTVIWFAIPRVSSIVRRFIGTAAVTASRKFGPRSIAVDEVLVEPSRTATTPPNARRRLNAHGVISGAQYAPWTAHQSRRSPSKGDPIVLVVALRR